MDPDNKFNVVTSTSSDKVHNRHKKKKNRFLRNAKGFAKQGIYGRGTHIENDQYTYFINILDTLKASNADDVEEKVNMANNVIEQTKEQEIHLASNQIVSKVLEYLMGYADENNLERFFTAFAENFRPLCSDPYASHVLQKMIEIAFLRSVTKENLRTNNFITETGPAKKHKVANLNEEDYNTQTQFSKGHKDKCAEFVMRVGKFLLNNLEDFVWDTCANHIIRTCILSLVGIYVPKVAFDKSNSADILTNAKVYEVSMDWREVMKEFPERLQMWPQFVDFPYHEYTSALLGVICISLRVVNKNLLKHFGKKILMKSFLISEDNDNDKKLIVPDDDGYDNDVNDVKENSNENRTEIKNKPQSEELQIDKLNETIKLPKVFNCQSSVRLLETLLSVAGTKLLTQLYAMLFTGRVALLAKGQLTNFSVQKLLLHIKQKEDFEAIFDELFDHVEELLKMGITGVVSAMSSSCLRFGTKQSPMIVGLQTALQVPSGNRERDNAFFKCLIKLKPYELTLNDNYSFVHLHGSLIIQDILKFNKPIFLVNCILNTSPDELASVFKSPNGSYITDAYLQSKFVGVKSREKLIRHLQGYYLDLAITRAGSRVIENFFNDAQDGQKEHIVKELADKFNLLKASPYGRIICNKFNIETYRLSAAQWKNSLQRKENKAAELFKGIIN